MGEGVQPFRESDPFKGRGAGLHHHHGLGIGQADVFASGDEHASKNESGVFTGFHHACEPKQRRIRIRSPQRLDVGTDGVVMGITLFVVENSALLNRLLGSGQID